MPRKEIVFALKNTQTACQKSQGLNKTHHIDIAIIATNPLRPNFHVNQDKSLILIYNNTGNVCIT